MSPPTHPQYTSHLDDWIMMLDFYAGSRVVKSKGKLYLPPTATMEADGFGQSDTIGEKAYQNYLMRAVFPNYVSEAVEKYLGLILKNSPKVMLPPEMEYLRKDATPFHETIEGLLKRIYAQQLITGRCGVLADLSSNLSHNIKPYLSLYTGLTILNWDDGRHEEVQTDNASKLRFVVLDESGDVPNQQTFSWEHRERYRLCYFDTVYRTGVFVDSLPNTADDTLTEPSIMGNLAPEIPFVFFNAKDNLPDVSDPPLLQLAHLCGAIYRGQADYRQNLYMQGQDTLVITGKIKGKNTADDIPTEEVRVGAGSIIYLSEGSSAEYVGVSASGLSEQRESVANDCARAEAMSGKFSSTVADAESGEALRIKMAAVTAMLSQISSTGAAGLENVLKSIASWIGADRDAVSVEPNLEFGDSTSASSDLLALIQAKNAGAPISMASIHKNIQDQGLTDLSFEDELDTIAKETNQNLILQNTQSNNSQNGDQK